MAKKSLSGLDFKAPILLSGSVGTSGQVLASQGAGVAPIWITSSTPVSASSIVLGIVYGSTSDVYGSNVSLGYQSLNTNAGSGNVAVGYQALFTNSSGSYNSAFGSYSLLSNTSGSQNSAFGSGALEANTTGSGNTAIGNNSLGLNTIGYNNIAIGDGALSLNTSAVSNIAIGVSALSSKVAGNYNTVIGELSLNNSTSGSNNVTLGANTLSVNLTGSRNTAIGTSAGYSQTGSDNISIGYEAGYNEAGSGKLYISNSNTATPLIYGNFYASELTINGTLSTTGNVTAPSFIKSGGTASQFLKANGTSDSTAYAQLVSPSFTTPSLGVATATSINGTTIPTSKTLTVTTDIGVSVQAYDADLNAIAVLAGTSGFLKKTALNTWSLDTATYAPLVSPSFTTPSLGVATATSINGTTVPTSATLITTTSGTALLAANISGGTAGQIPYQSAPDTTTFIATGTTGQVLTSNGTAAPTWANATSASTSLDPFLLMGA